LGSQIKGFYSKQQKYPGTIHHMHQVQHSRSIIIHQIIARFAYNKNTVTPTNNYRKSQPVLQQMSVVSNGNTQCDEKSQDHSTNATENHHSLVT